ETLRLQPQWMEIENKEAWLRATHPDGEKRNGAQGLVLAKQICQASENREARFLDTLAAALAENGQFDRAVTVAREALKIATASQEDNVDGEIQSHLELYQNGKPFRTSQTPRH